MKQQANTAFSVFLQSIMSAIIAKFCLVLNKTFDNLLNQFLTGYLPCKIVSQIFGILNLFNFLRILSIMRLRENLLNKLARLNDLG